MKGRSRPSRSYTIVQYLTVLSFLHISRSTYSSRRIDSTNYILLTRIGLTYYQPTTNDTLDRPTSDLIELVASGTRTDFFPFFVRHFSDPFRHTYPNTHSLELPLATDRHRLLLRSSTSHDQLISCDLPQLCSPRSRSWHPPPSTRSLPLSFLREANCKMELMSLRTKMR